MTKKRYQHHAPEISVCQDIPIERVKIILRNDFHDSTAVVWARDDHLTKYQVDRARRKLCGVADCQCGGVAGIRGPQRDAGGRWIILESTHDGGADITLAATE